jgi:hypothetical protein
LTAEADASAAANTMADAAPVSAAASTMDSVFNMIVFLFGLDLIEEGNPKWPARLTWRTNDPAGHRKQIQLQYAGIGGSYGCASKRRLLTNAFNYLDIQLDIAPWRGLSEVRRRKSSTNA